MRRVVSCFAAALALGLSFGGAGAEIYKWVDESGNVVYSQSPPPEGEATRVKTRKAPISDAAAREQLKALTDRADDRQKNRALVAEGEKQADDLDARRRQNCEQARANLKILNESARVRANDKDGNPFYLDEETKQKKQAEAQDQIQQFCG